MNAVHSPSEAMVERLRRSGLADFVAAILEAAAPLAFVGAQAAYLVEPVLGSRTAEVARALEDPQQLAGLVERLRRPEAGP